MHPKPTVDREDWQGLLILADWHEEYGDPIEGAFWRWVAAIQKRPYRYATEPMWFNEADQLRRCLAGNRSDIASDLPPVLFYLLVDGKLRDEPVYRQYRTGEEADADLLQAYKKWQNHHRRSFRHA